VGDSRAGRRQAGGSGLIAQRARVGQGDEDLRGRVVDSSAGGIGFGEIKHLRARLAFGAEQSGQRIRPQVPVEARREHEFDLIRISETPAALLAGSGWPASALAKCANDSPSLTPGATNCWGFRSSRNRGIADRPGYGRGAMPQNRADDDSWSLGKLYTVFLKNLSWLKFLFARDQTVEQLAVEL